MKIQTYILGAALLVAGAIGCQSMGLSDDQLLTNPSFHILVHEEHPIPDSGTFTFDTKVFKIGPEEHVDLSEVDVRITAALRAELEGKGFREVSKGGDLKVSYAVAMNAPLSGADINAAYSDEFPIQALVKVNEHDMHYKEGALIVDFVESRSRTLLWRGAIMAEIEGGLSDRDKDRRAALATRILLGNFPRP